MRQLLGISYEELCSELGTRPAPVPTDEAGLDFVVYHDGNEFLFLSRTLMTINIMNPPAIEGLLQTEFPRVVGLTSTLTLLNESNTKWEVFSKYCQGHWVVIRVEPNVLFEFEFVGGAFRRQRISMSSLGCIADPIP